MTRGLPSLPPPVPSYRDRVAPSNKAKVNAMCVNAMELGCISDGIFDNYDILQTAMDDYGDTYGYDNAMEICFPPQVGTNDNGFNHYLIKQPLYSGTYMLSLRGVPGLSEYSGVALCTDGGEDIFGAVDVIRANGLGFICGMEPDGTTDGSAAGACFGDMESGHFTDCWFETGGTAIKSSNFGRSFWDRCQFYGGTAFDPMSHHFSANFTACIFGNMYQAVTKSGANSTLDYLSVVGCDFFNHRDIFGDGSTQRPWIETELRNPPGSTQNGAEGGVMIANNVFGNSCRAIDIDGRNGSGYSSSFPQGKQSTALVVVQGNLLHANLPRAGEASIKVDTDYGLIANNVLGPMTASVAGDAIMVQGDHNRVTGNVVKGHRYGVNVLSGATNTAVENNTLSGTTGPLLDNGTGTTNANNMA